VAKNIFIIIFSVWDAMAAIAGLLVLKERGKGGSTRDIGEFFI
jgi:hypothetical protein